MYTYIRYMFSGAPHHNRANEPQKTKRQWVNRNNIERSSKENISKYIINCSTQKLERLNQVSNTCYTNTNFENPTHYFLEHLNTTCYTKKTLRVPLLIGAVQFNLKYMLDNVQTQYFNASK